MDPPSCWSAMAGPVLDISAGDPDGHGYNLPGLTVSAPVFPD